MKKADIEFHWDRSQRHPAINIKWHTWLHGSEFREMFDAACTERGLPTGMDLDKVFTDSALQSIWDDVAEMQYHDAEREVVNIYSSEMGRKVEVWQEGRSGGWMIVDGLPDVESWDAIMVSRWGRVVKVVKSYLDDCDYQLAWSLAEEIATRAEAFV